MTRISNTQRFDEELNRLFKKDKRYMKKMEKTIKLLKADLGYPSLRFHKLEGRDCYSISVDMKIRVIFGIRDDTILLLRVGTHDEVY